MSESIFVRILPETHPPSLMREPHATQPDAFSGVPAIAEVCAVSPLDATALRKPGVDAHIPLSPPRCLVKGCVFPVNSKGMKCHYHELQQTEPSLFESHQPSRLLAIQAPCELPEAEPEDSR